MIPYGTEYTCQHGEPCDDCPQRCTNPDPLARLRTGDWLDAQDFPPLRYAVPGILPEDLFARPGSPTPQESTIALSLVMAGAPLRGEVRQHRLGHLRLLALDQLGDRDDLNLGELLVVGRVPVKPAVAGRFQHAFGGLLHADEDAHRGALRMDGAYQVSDVAGVGRAALDRNQGTVGVAPPVEREPDCAIDVLVAYLLFVGLAVEHHHAPPLELEWRSS
jgi:hypothetical protein